MKDREQLLRRRPAAGAARLLFVTGSAVGALLVACGGGSGGANHEASNQPGATSSTTEAPTVASTPTPEATATAEALFEPKSVLNTEFLPTSIDQVKDAIASIYELYPELIDGAGTSFNQEVMNYNIDGCQRSPEFENQPPAIIQTDRSSRCYYIISGLNDFYSQTGQRWFGSNEIYQAEVAVKNYYLTEYTDQDSQQEFIGSLKEGGIK